MGKARSAAAAIAALLTLAVAAQAQTGRKPTAQEVAAIRDCAAKYRDDVAEGERHCLFDLVATPCTKRPEGSSNLGTADCYHVEWAIWDELLNKNFKSLLDRLDEEQAGKARAMQRAWVAYRDVVTIGRSQRLLDPSGRLGARRGDEIEQAMPLALGNVVSIFCGAVADRCDLLRRRFAPGLGLRRHCRASTAQQWPPRTERALPIPSPRLSENLPADQHAADFAGAGADFVELCVAQQTARGIIVDIAVAAEQLMVSSAIRSPVPPRIDRAGGVFARGLAAVARFATA